MVDTAFGNGFHKGQSENCGEEGNKLASRIYKVSGLVFARKRKDPSAFGLTGGQRKRERGGCCFWYYL